MDEVTDAQLKQFRDKLATFVEFNEAEWIVMTQYISVKQFKKKAFFVEPGEVCNYLGFVATGSVRYFHIIDGKDITNYFSFENDFVSSYKSFLTGEPCISYIEALEPSTILVVSKKNWEEMLSNPVLAYKIERLGRLIAEYYLICYEDRVTGFITQTPEKRYLQLVESGKDIIRRMPQHYIANFLGITPVSLLRMRKRIMVNSR